MLQGVYRIHRLLAVIKDIFTHLAILQKQRQVSVTQEAKPHLQVVNWVMVELCKVIFRRKRRSRNNIAVRKFGGRYNYVIKEATLRRNKQNKKVANVLVRLNCV